MLNTKYGLVMQFQRHTTKAQDLSHWFARDDS